MPPRNARTLEWTVLAVALALLALDAGGGSGWALTSTRAVLAVRLDHTAAAPLYDLLAGAAGLLPVGEAGFRLALLGAALGALTLAGIVAAARALLPKEPTAGVIAALVLVVAPPFRDALVTPAILAACGAVWALAGAVRYRRDRSDVRPALRALLASAVVIGAAPWLGLALAVGLVLWLGAPKQLVAIAIAAIGLAIILWWFDAIGSLPSARVDLVAAVAASGRGAGAVVIGAGLLGFGFGAATGLAHVRAVAAFAAVCAAHEVVIGDSAVAMLAVFALGAAIIAAAIARLALPDVTAWKREAAVIACGAPLLVAAFAMGATIVREDPGPVPRRLVADLVDRLPSGPGTFLATRPTPWFALQYERVVAGLRPDLELVPPLPPERADVIAANALRAKAVVGADASAFGRLDAELAVPRGRGFQLVGAIPDRASAVEPPATYATPTGAEEALALAIERARLEAASGRLATAARAAGLSKRFGAADLAVLAAVTPMKDHPALFGFLPLGAIPRGPWLIDTFGDDLAWVANIPQTDPPGDAPMPRKLHALWRKIFIDQIKATDPAIAALGPAAVAATTEMLRVLKPEKNTAP